MLILCFDFGMKYIGVAVGQRLTNTTTSLPCLRARDGIPQELELRNLINSWNPGQIIVGDPVGLEGEIQAITHAARKFAKRIQIQYPHIPLSLVDERYTTKEARKLNRRPGTPAEFATLNSLAAEIILQRWLET